MPESASPERTFSRKVVLTVTIALLAVLLAVLIIYSAEVLTLLFAGVLLAIFLSAPADLLARATRMPRPYALVLVLLGLFLLVGLVGFLMGKTIYTQTQELQVTLPRAMTTLETDLERTDWLRQLLVTPTTAPASAPAAPAAPAEALAAATATAPATEPATHPAATGVLAELTHRLNNFFTETLTSQTFYRRAGGAISATFGVIGDLVVIAAIGLYLALTPSQYVNGFVALFPRSRRGRVREVLGEVGRSLQWWFVGQLGAMACIGMLTYIGLLALGVPAALTLAILAGLMTFVPNFGPFLAAIPAVVIAFAPHGAQTAVNPRLALYVIVLYACVQFLEGWLITPMIQKRAVELPPALIMFAQVLLALLLGPLGLVLATPILAAILVIVKMVYVEDVLGDRREKADVEQKPAAERKSAAT